MIWYELTYGITSANSSKGILSYFWGGSNASRVRS